VVDPVVDVVVDEVVDVLPHGSGVQVPAPWSVPPAAVHWAAVPSVQMNAPPGELGVQHWIGGAVVVVVVDVVVLVDGVGLVDVLVDEVVDPVVDPVVDVVVDEVVDVLPHGSGVQVPGPWSVPPAAVHCAGVSSVQMNAPPGELGVQHWIGGAVVVVVVDVEAVVVCVVAEVVVVVLLVLVVGAGVVDGGVIVVVVAGPTQVPSAAQASNLL